MTNEMDYSDTTKYKIMSSGGVYSYEAGRIVANLGGENSHQITKENAARMVERRREVAEQTARDALDVAAIKAGRLPKGAHGSGLGWYCLVEKVAELAFEAKSGRSMESLLAFLGRATGNIAREEEPPRRVVHEVTPEAVDAYRKLYAELRKALNVGEVVEGQVNE